MWLHQVFLFACEWRNFFGGEEVIKKVDLKYNSPLVNSVPLVTRITDVCASKPKECMMSRYNTYSTP